MALTNDQIDFAKPEHVSVICKGTQLTVHVKGTTSSVRLTYQLQEELPYPKYLADNLPKDILPPYPYPPLQQSEPRLPDTKLNCGKLKDLFQY
jgi:hypothetical protein